jgi:hypothetical protein
MCIEKLRKRWLDEVENDLKQTGVRGWREMARDRDDWKFTSRRPRSFMDRLVEKREWEEGRQISICSFGYIPGVNM